MSAPCTPLRAARSSAEAGDDRLAAADVALEQPRHRPARAEVRRDLRRPPASALRSAGTAAPGRPRAATRRRPRAGFPCARSRRARLSSIRAASARSSSRASRGRARSASASSAGKVRRLERRDHGRRRAAGRLEIRREGIERAAHERPPRPRRDVRDAARDADDASGVQRIGLLLRLEELGLGVLETQLAPRRDRGRAVEDRRPARLRGLQKARIPVVPDDADRLAAVVGERLDAQSRRAACGAPRARRAARRASPAPRERAPSIRREPAPVFVPEREVQQDVGDGRQTGLGEARGARADRSRKARDGIRERDRSRRPGGRRRAPARAARVTPRRPGTST